METERFMPRIMELPAHVADLIAAGEVVERPGSVVKELVENSIDAGATSVTVEIRRGGMGYIRVTDNGCGIAPEDVGTAFLRHATSKLRTARDLEAIGTLGFRGEALAAIAAVSRVEMITRTADSAEGTRIELEGGKVTQKRPEGCPVGTTIIIRDLFFNTPARLKFMKNDRAEGANVSAVVLRMALSHPEVSLKYVKDGAEELHTPGDGKLESTIYSTLGREFAAGLLRAGSDAGDVKVSGYVSAPANCRGNRSWQFFFLNGRHIKSKTLQAAVEQAYKNSLFTGRFPVCVLDITINLGAVDVNVHPAKTEVRFTNEKAVFDAVYYAVRGALEATENSAVEMDISPGTRKVLGDAPVAPVRGGLGNERPAPSSGGSYTAKPREDFFVRRTADEFTGTYRQKSRGGDVTFFDSQRGGTSQYRIELPAQNAAPAAPAITTELETPDFRIVGEAFTTYIVAEQGDSLFLIDKHAAHEREIFDALRESAGEPVSQMLLTPAVCDVGPDNAALILDSAELLGEYGFDVSDFGGGKIALRQVPAELADDDPRALMEELCQELQAGRNALDGLRDGIMHTVACRAAIKAGTSSDPREVRNLVAKVLSGQIKYCPHGRPVAMEITKNQLDRNFKRV